MGLKTCALNLNRANKELSPHGTIEFPCAGYSARYDNSEDMRIPWHWHEELEIVYLKSGTMSLQVPGKIYHLIEGDGCAVNSNILHSAITEPACELHSLVFSPRLVAGDENSVFANKYITPLTNCASFDVCLLDTASLPGLMKAFEALLRGGAGYEFTVREELSAICLSLYIKFEQVIYAKYTEPGKDSIRIRKMMDYIHKHYSEDIGLSGIAGEAGVGERECLRCFQKTIQISPIQYLLKYRVTQGASMLLRDKDTSISEISGQCGFDSPGNFAQVFKRFYGCSPREYRKSYLAVTSSHTAGP